LVSFIDEHAFGDLKSFREQFANLAQDEVFQTLKDRLKPICCRTLRRQVTAYIPFTKRFPLVEEFTPEESEDRLYDAVSEYLRRDNLQALPASQRSLMTLVLRKLLASSTFAIAGALETLSNRLKAKLKKHAPQPPLEEELGQEYEALNETVDEWSEDDAEQPLADDARAALEREIADLDSFTQLAQSINYNAKGRALLKASIDTLVKSLEAGHSDVLSSYLTAMAQFHNYSFQNILLIASQRPTATKVAGIRTWNELGRRVRRGEKGIMIFAPLIGYKRNANEPDARTDKPEPRLVGFRSVYVFDVEQTEGEELPELGNTVTGEVGDKLDRLIGFTEAQTIKLEFSDAIAPARGMSYGGLIRILPELEESETFATLIHELAHEMLHKAERRTMTTPAVRETEAEAVAFVVCHALGLETGTGSSDYIQLYHGDANLLKESLEVVQRTSNVILGAISPEVTNRQKSDAEVR